MSKKNKKKDHWSFYTNEIGGGYGKRRDKNKKKKSKYDDPDFKTVTPTLDKDDAKENKHLLQTPVEIPKEFTKNRHKCNHAGRLITVQEFKNMTPMWAAYTPMLDSVVDTFGEDNVKVCALCYDVVVSPEAVNTDAMIKAVAILYAAANKIVSGKRFKTEEVKDISKVKDSLFDWFNLFETMNKVDSIALKRKSAGTYAENSSGSSLSREDYNALNRIDGSGPTVM